MGGRPQGVRAAAVEQLRGPTRPPGERGRRARLLPGADGGRLPSQRVLGEHGAATPSQPGHDDLSRGHPGPPLRVGPLRGDAGAIRRHGNELQGSAFGEGWGLYSERLADELGLYADEHERVGMLEMQALRAARLVVDTGIHAFGWTRDRVVATLEDTGLPTWMAEAETDRYVAMPGQALSYRVGQREIERWRYEASRREGFRLADFHDRLLQIGSLPLPALRRELGAAGKP